MVLKRFSYLLNKRINQDHEIPAGLDTPEANAVRSIRAFCHAGYKNTAPGDEAIHLPAIVESAVASPAAAYASANEISKFLSKDHYSRPAHLYHAIMLLRILVDNPGAPFTRNIDQKFCDTIKSILRNYRDPSVLSILNETLASFEREKAHDKNLEPLLNTWRKEVGATGRRREVTFQLPDGSTNPTQSSSSKLTSPSRKLPPIFELNARIEEARTSAKLLLQLIQSTPQSEFLKNDLIREFTERCQSAQHNLQTYISSEDPSLDESTLVTMIETSEQLGVVGSRYQRALLAAKKSMASNATAVTGNGSVEDPGDSFNRANVDLLPKDRSGYTYMNTEQQLQQEPFGNNYGQPSSLHLGSRDSPSTRLIMTDTDANLNWLGENEKVSYGSVPHPPNVMEERLMSMSEERNDRNPRDNSNILGKRKLDDPFIDLHNDDVPAVVQRDDETSNERNINNEIDNLAYRRNDSIRY